MSRVTLVFIFLLSTCCLKIHAQQVWTLQQCIDYALSHNISIKQSALNVELSKSITDQSAANLFPTLNGFAAQNYYFGRSIDPYTNLYTNAEVRSNTFSLSSTMPLFEGFQLQNTLRQSKLNYMASKYDLEKVKNDISLNVAAAYLQVLYNRDLSKTTLEQRDATKVQQERTKKMEEAGAASKGNFLDIESQLALDEVRLVTAQSQLDQSLLTLKQLLEIDTVNDFNIVQPELPVQQMSVTYADANSIYQTALSNQPDIKSYSYKVESAQKGLSIAKGGVLPRLSLNGSLATTYSTSNLQVTDYAIGDPRVIGYTSSFDSVYNIPLIPKLEKTPFSDQLDGNLGKSIGLNLSVPLFNGWSTRTNIQRAKINLEQTQLGYETARKTLYKSIQQAVQDAKAAYQKYEAGLKSVQAQEEAINFNEQRYNLGLINSYDYLLSKNNLSRAQADLLQSKYDYIFRLKVLDFYMGKPLSF